jgi:GT2 family glycosyltransferase
MRYEPSLSRFLVGVTGSAANAVGHGLKSSGLRGGIAGAVDASSALAAWATRRAPRPLDERSAPIPDGGKAASVTVVVATYRRAAQLRECIDGLRGQIRPPDQIVVVRRLEDAESASVTSEIGAYAEEVVVHAPGQTAALRAGADRATGDVLAFLDDDAVPRRDWLLRLLAPYADPGVVAVGGRDVVYHDGEIEVGSRRTVGRLSWLGRLTGNHHLGDGRARPVDFLIGCNCSYRREVFSIPIGLRGTGAQVANDLATSLRASTAFGRVIYEPGALVDHFPGTRFGDDTRVNPNRAAVSDSIYNQAFVVASLRPDMRNLRLAYLLAVGDRVSPGLGRSLLAVARGETEVAGRLRLSAATVIRATRDAGRHPLEFDTDPGTPTNGADRQRLARAGC